MPTNEPRKQRVVYLTDDEYGQCKRAARNLSFTEWARELLLSEAQQIALPAGMLPGSMCGCRRGEAWFYHRKQATHLCQTCAAPLLKRYPWVIEDRHPAKASEEYEALLDAVVRATEALVAFHRRKSPPALKLVDNVIPLVREGEGLLPDDIAELVAGARLDEASAE